MRDRRTRSVPIQRTWSPRIHPINRRRIARTRRSNHGGSRHLPITSNHCFAKQLGTHVQSTAASQRRIAIVGDGIAGFRLADILSRAENPPHITLFGRDSIPSCNRPLLSKSYLLGTATPAELSVPRKNAEGYTVSPHSVNQIDIERCSLITASGTTHTFDDIVIATGLQPRRLPHTPECELITLTTAKDANILTQAVSKGRPIKVIGGGMLALEAASTLNALGAETKLVTRSALPLQHTLGSVIAVHLAQRIQDSGVDWQVTTRPDLSVSPTELTVSAIGSDLDTSIFVSPNEHFTSARGIPVNENFQSATHPRIWVIGDAAIWPDGRTHPQWFSALESARRAAAGLSGSAPAQGWREFVHSGWSDQWGLRIQTFGLLADTDELDAQLLVDTNNEIVVGFVDAARILRGIAAVSPQGKPSPALQLRAKLGLTLD